MQIRTQSHTGPLDQSETVHVGVDVQKATYSVAGRSTGHGSAPPRGRGDGGLPQE